MVAGIKKKKKNIAGISIKTKFCDLKSILRVVESKIKKMVVYLLETPKHLIYLPKLHII